MGECVFLCALGQRWTVDPSCVCSLLTFSCDLGLDKWLGEMEYLKKILILTYFTCLKHTNALSVPSVQSHKRSVNNGWALFV